MRAVPPLSNLYARLALALERGDPIDSDSARAIADDLIRRRTSVESFAPTAAFLPSIIRWLFHGASAGVLLILSLLMLTLGARALAAMLIIAAALFLVHTVASHRLYRACRVSITGVCVACGYSLAGLDDAVPPARLRGASIGPARCPECATQWPKVPRES